MWHYVALWHMWHYVWCLFTSCFVKAANLLISVSKDSNVLSSLVIVGCPYLPLTLFKSSVINCRWNWLIDAFVSLTSVFRRPEFCGLLAHAHSSLPADVICATSWSAADHASDAFCRNLMEKYLYVHITPPKRHGRLVLQWGMEGPMRGVADGEIIMDGVGQT